MAQLSLQHIDKIYDNNVQAVFDFNLDVKDGEFIVLVGPSGCGKSTTLRMVAGLEDISNGKLFLDGKDITHLNVAQHIALGVGYCASDRHRYGMVSDMSLSENMMLKSSYLHRWDKGGWISWKSVDRYTRDKISQYSDRKDSFRVRLNGLEFSLSGMENKVKEMVADHRLPSDIARFTLLTIASAVERTTQAARRQYPGLPVIVSGGVASNSLLREKLSGAIFAPAAYSTDNAMGTAVLAMRRLQRGE